MSPKRATMPAGPMLISVLEALRHRPRTLTLRQISSETAIPFAWLKALPRNRAPDVNRIEVLKNYFESSAPPSA